MLASVRHAIESAMAETAMADRILATLEHRDPPAALVTEVAATLRPAPSVDQLEEALQVLGQVGRVLIADHAAPDIHLEGLDLRVVAMLPPERDEQAALAAAESYWSSWLRAFLSTHRCQ
jgi:hypothetical protein